MPVPFHWHTEPFLLITILGVGWLYALYTGPLNKKHAYPVRQSLCFYLGLLLVYLTVASPLDQIGEDFLFSLHMVQHMILIYILPPIFIVSTPVWLLDSMLENPVVLKVVKCLVHPVVAGLVFTFTYTVWHIPVLYEMALWNKQVHILEHWTMFLTAILIFWSILSPSKRLPASSYGVKMLYVFVLMIGQFPVFGYLTFSGEVFYPTYEFAPRIIGLSALEDQVLGGVIMKLFNMVASLAVFGGSFYAWYRSDEALD